MYHVLDTSNDHSAMSVEPALIIQAPSDGSIYSPLSTIRTLDMFDCSLMIPDYSDSG